MQNGKLGAENLGEIFSEVSEISKNSEFSTSPCRSRLTGILDTLGSLELEGYEPGYCLSCCISVKNSVIDPRQIYSLQFKLNLHNKFNKFAQLLPFHGKLVLLFLVQVQFWLICQKSCQNGNQFVQSFLCKIIG